MKKIIALLMAMVLVLALAACGEEAATETKAPEATEGAEGEATTPAASEGEGTTATTGIKVGAIYINSKNDTAGYTFAHHNGITTAMTELGLDPATDLVIVDEVPEDKQQVLDAIDILVGSDCDIIFGISFGYIDAFTQAAEEYTDVIFSHATGYMANETNFNNYFGRIYQARYLAGIAAGLKSLEMGNNNVGYVAAHTTDYAETASGINGFALGVQAANPNATVYVKNLNNWADEINEKAFAEELISAYGCGVISQHCDSAQPQIAAQNAGVFGCGYNSDMTGDAPAAHLTAAIWNWNVYYGTAIEAAMACEGDASLFVEKMGGSAYFGGLAEGFVDVSPLTENCAAGTEEAIAAVKALMVNGEWDVFTGVKLNITVAEDGTVTVEQVEAAMESNGFMYADGNFAVPMDNTVVIEAGAPSVDDGVIKGSMNWLVKGVQE